MCLWLTLFALARGQPTRSGILVDGVASGRDRAPEQTRMAPDKVGRDERRGHAEGVREEDGETDGADGAHAEPGGEADRRRVNPLKELVQTDECNDGDGKAFADVGGPKPSEAHGALVVLGASPPGSSRRRRPTQGPVGRDEDSCERHERRDGADYGGGGCGFDLADSVVCCQDERRS